MQCNKLKSQCDSDVVCNITPLSVRVLSENNYKNKETKHRTKSTKVYFTYCRERSSLYYIITPYYRIQLKVLEC